METCPFCKKEISLAVSVCPHCQKSLQPEYPSMNSKVFIVIWVFFVALIVVMLVTIVAR
jgi:predicted nucleic acid-binding Zn ribbon protein